MRPAQPTSAKATVQALGVSYPTANKLISEFVRLGLVEEITGRSRSRVFDYRPYLDQLGGPVERDTQ